MPLILTAILLGIVEGLTEFLPVSSTGHLILAAELLGYRAEQWATFNVIIQLGAILAVIVLYWRTFWTVATGLFAREAGAWRFALNIAVAFIPSAVLGLLLIDNIEALLGSAKVVCVALIVGGIAILVIERLVKPAHIEPGVAAIPLKRALGIERRTAAEFSFFLAVPTMLGATTLSVAKHHEEIAAAGVDWGLIAIGFTVSFVVAVAVIKWFVGIVGRYGFAPFAWYRIVAGGAALIWLMMR